ncbi:MAG: HAMP domain-containing histidine kinase [Alphaproteobacteria bacterium]|nr:HAMP domain-containing histidine kinase [Alphaproteobacteria bacterium]
MAEPSHEDRDHPPAGPWRALAARAASLPGKLLGLSVLFVFVAEILIFFPSAANFRTEWMRDRADAAHLAALAADAAAEQDVMLSDQAIRDLLAGADAVSISRITDGANELVLGGFIGEAVLVSAELEEESLLDRIVRTCDALLAPPGRFLRIVAKPRAAGSEAERISVILPETGLRAELIAYSRNIFWLSLFIAAVTGGLLYGVLLVIFVRPMRKLASAMTAFKDDPADPARTVTPSGRADEIGEAEAALAAMQADVRAAFAQRERLAALGGAVARINHDLRNVLASAQLISDRLAMSKDERVAAMGARLLRAVDRGIRLCQDTLDYGRTSERAPDMVTVTLRNAVDDAAGDAFAATGAADWRNEINETLEVSADPDHLHRIFLNLIRNALQAMEGQDEPVLIVTAAGKEGAVLVQLRDTGPGVPDRIAETLFEPFGRSGSKAGSGLGLSIARELARAMGGGVRLLETGPEGSVFEVKLKAV